MPLPEILYKYKLCANSICLTTRLTIHNAKNNKNTSKNNSMPSEKSKEKYHTIIRNMKYFHFHKGRLSSNMSIYQRHIHPSSM